MKKESPVTKFREELTKIMPGYRWTIHNLQVESNCLAAEGIQSSGFNRLSTLEVFRREKNGVVNYDVRSAGFGKRAPWLAIYSGKTLARALRGLQAHYEDHARIYSKHASDLEAGRKAVVEEGVSVGKEVPE